MSPSRSLRLIPVLLVVAGCVATRAPLPAWEGPEAEAALAALEDFQFDGRVAIRRGEQGVTAGVQWSQHGEDVQARLSGPFGAGALRLGLQGNQLSIDDGRTRLEGVPAREAMAEQLGFDPPLEKLRWWLRGLPAPGQVTSLVRDEAQRLASLEQDGWQVQFQEYRDETLQQHRIAMPRRLRASRESLDLRLVIDSWQLPP